MQNKLLLLRCRKYLLRKHRKNSIGIFFSEKNFPHELLGIVGSFLICCLGPCFGIFVKKNIFFSLSRPFWVIPNPKVILLSKKLRKSSLPFVYTKFKLQLCNGIQSKNKILTNSNISISRIFGESFPILKIIIQLFVYTYQLGHHRQPLEQTQK